jgi:hypothetical protein
VQVGEAGSPPAGELVIHLAGDLVGETIVQVVGNRIIRCAIVRTSRRRIVEEAGDIMSDLVDPESRNDVARNGMRLTNAPLASFTVVNGS